MDYAFSGDIPHYYRKLDKLAGRDGLQLRDEIRMVRPGFYLGRAYTGRVFFLNFILYNEQLANGETGAFDEDCSVGWQRKRMAALTK